jgi:ribonuclease HII
MKKIELLSSYSSGKIEAGVDEAGRGCLAGPVVAAAVILPPDFRHPFLTDSKQLSEKKRNQLRPIIEQEAISWAIGKASEAEIDSINILQASFLAMHRAIEQLNQVPELLLIDGNRFKKYRQIDHVTVIGGDGKYLAIAAASILAKTERDAEMKLLHQEFPSYCWDKNMGYGTQKHRDAIREIGPCIHHRMSFTILPNQLSLFSNSEE